MAKNYNRAQLVSQARAIYISQGGHFGLNRTQAAIRFDKLISGNTNAQLAKYIKKWGGKSGSKAKKSGGAGGGAG